MSEENWGNLPPCPFNKDIRADQSKTGSWRSIRPEINQGKCLKCGLCVTFCPEGVAEIIDRVLNIDYDYCKGCGICAEECPSHAIKMVSEVA